MAAKRKSKKKLKKPKKGKLIKQKLQLAASKNPTNKKINFEQINLNGNLQKTWI